MIVPPATFGAIRLGSGRGVEKIPALISLTPAVDLVDDERAERDPDHRPDQEPEPARSNAHPTSAPSAIAAAGSPGGVPRQWRVSEVRGPCPASSQPEHITVLVTTHFPSRRRNLRHFVTCRRIARWSGSSSFTAAWWARE